MGAGLGRIATGFASICVAQVTVAAGALLVLLGSLLHHVLGLHGCIALAAWR